MIRLLSTRRLSTKKRTYEYSDCALRFRKPNEAPRHIIIIKKCENDNNNPLRIQDIMLLVNEI